ncbi:TPA: cell division protein FtsN [Bacillus thuringiensis]|uniref:SipW-cognate class signal peptide n=3 Tax=Bacillus cereus group TaxID=86661 RepID=A0ABC9SPG5_BACCE|nr:MULTISPECIES: TasA family protein [Bacillus]ABE11531.1 putative spore coat-associated protein [Bacillus thuringiensis serovar tenebrionis]EJP81915.1 SipW-cognate class signal peptide [Bacillus cereus VD022]EOQ56295.1 SipW-cognate class signal peptide [Bacillus cereus TIAC219]MED3102025.1 TasA family protein [Bacillus thuringiensis]OTY41073.1 cell division protein FtsN [Bacillus thuringiensis serovar poloniensis]
MSLKKKLGVGVVSAALGLSLIGGGTYAYFSDQVVSNNTLAAGTLDLAMQPTTSLNLDNLKPGDKILKKFNIKNSGTLDIKDILMKVDYTVNDFKKDNSVEDFGKHIKVQFLWDWDPEKSPVYETTLAELKSQHPEVASQKIFLSKWAETGGLKAGKMDWFWIKFTFEDNGTDQNMFQGDSIAMKMEFQANQTEGQER